jgi:exopolyphosphatase/guanosine-5'-triphosphate,3'-diphosphate pyrophosphatase
LAKHTAIIDFGSNSVRLVIFERTSRFGFKIVHESKSRVRIGEGAYAKGGVLQEEPMKRALLALSSFKKIISGFKARKTLAIATSAMRDAPNRSIFISKVSKELGIQIKVIDGKKEAFLGGVATANLLKFDKGITIDIGGGSTEFAQIENRRVLETYSLNLGTVRLKELFGEKRDFESAKIYIRAELQKLPTISEKNLIGIGGTLRALAKVISSKIEYPIPRIHNFEFDFKRYKQFINSILYLENRELLKLGFKKERLDVIRWGLLILLETAKKLEAEKFITSGVGIREGLFLTDILRNQRNRFPDNFNPSLRNILDEFQLISEQVSKNRFKTSIELFEILKDRFKLSEKDKTILGYASKLSEIGIKVDFYGNSKNGFHLILNSFIYNLTHKESLLVATLVRYGIKEKISQKFFEEYKSLLPEFATLSSLHAITYISQLLTKDYSNSREFSFKLKNERLLITIFNEPLYYMLEEKFGKLEILDVELKFQL